MLSSCNDINYDIDLERPQLRLQFRLSDCLAGGHYLPRTGYSFTGAPG